MCCKIHLSLFQLKYSQTQYIFKKNPKTLYLIKMITAFSFFKLSYPEGQLEWVLFPPKQLQPLSLFVFLSLSPSFSSLHCGSVNCSYSNIPSLPSPQLSYSQPLSCGIINLLVLSTCKSQTIEPYGAILGCVVTHFGVITEPQSLSDHLTIDTLLRAFSQALVIAQYRKRCKNVTPK